MVRSQDGNGEITKDEFTSFVQKQAAVARRQDKKVQRESTKRRPGQVGEVPHPITCCSLSRG